MSTTTEERVAVVEANVANIHDDLIEIKATLKALNIIAQRGSGMFHAVLLIGGLLGWVIGIVVSGITALHWLR